MQRVGPRIYQITDDDYPIEVRIEAKDLESFLAVVSEAMVTRPDGTMVTRFPLPLDEPGGEPLVREFVIPDPADPSTPAAARYTKPANITTLTLTSFATANGENPRYEFTITAASGDVETTINRRPTVGEGRVPLTFRYR